MASRDCSSRVDESTNRQSLPAINSDRPRRGLTGQPNRFPFPGPGTELMSSTNRPQLDYAFSSSKGGM